MKPTSSPARPARRVRPAPDVRPARRVRLAAGVPLAAALLAATAAAGCAGPPGGAFAEAMAMAPPSASASSSSAVGRLVPGVPGVVPVPPGAHVTASAVERQGNLLAVSVTGTSGTSVPALLAFFHDRLHRASFTATDDSLLPPGASGAAFGRGGRELLVVAVVDHGTDRSWSIGGTVAP